jgi:hypothetical protein
MLNQNGQYVDHWGSGASVPDISRLETRMFFYFMAKKYMGNRHRGNSFRPG